MVDWIPQAATFDAFFRPDEGRLKRLTTAVLPFLDAEIANASREPNDTTRTPASLTVALSIVLGTEFDSRGAFVSACGAYIRFNGGTLWPQTATVAGANLVRFVFADYLRTMIEEAVRFPTYFPEPLTKDPPCVSWSKCQMFSIMSCAFLCLFPRPSRNCCTVVRRFDTMPSINYDEMYYPQRDGDVEREKLIMFLDYVAAMHKRRELWSSATTTTTTATSQCEPTPGNSGATASEDAGVLLRPMVILRHLFSQVDLAARLTSSSATLMLPFTVHPLRHSIDEESAMLRIDFANALIGGASIAYGCVQEEITFSICPELNAARLIHSPMGHDEAIVLCGAEQFSLLKPGTYGFGMRYGGPVTPSPCPRGGAVLAIDAMDYRYVRPEEQYTRPVMQRELGKLLAALTAPVVALGGVPAEEASNVATGNWGCGVFGGDVELKLLLQWLACTLAGKHMHYFPFDEERVATVMVPLGEQLLQRRTTVEQILTFLHSIVASNASALANGRRRGRTGVPVITVWSLLKDFIATSDS